MGVAFMSLHDKKLEPMGYIHKIYSFFVMGSIEYVGEEIGGIMTSKLVRK